MTKRPNFLLILTDHWRGDALGRLRHPVAETPHLDAFSRGGVTFTRAYTPCASCIAARRSIMTGQTPASHGMLGYQDGMPWNYPDNLAGTLARAGYQTINVGKTHFHPPRLHLGFEQLVIPADYSEWLARQPGMEHDHRAHGVPGNSWIGRPSHLPEAWLEETYFVTRALECLRKRDPTRPFFLCLSFNGPHPPWCPPAVYYEQFRDRPLPPPVQAAWSERHAAEAGFPLDVNSWRGRLPEHLTVRARTAYFAYLAYLDAQIGRFLEQLRRSGLARNTFTCFTADHGEMLGDHNLWRKTYAYEGSSRIPFIITPPQGLSSRRNCETAKPVGLEDIMPTFLDAAGIGIPSAVEGRSLLPLLAAEGAAPRPAYHGEHAPCYHPENAHHFLTDGEWKFIWNPITGEEQLFNLTEDPAECSDLAGDERYGDTRAVWYNRLAEELAGRAEGFSDGRQLRPAPCPAWRGGDPRQVHTG